MTYEDLKKWYEAVSVDVKFVYADSMNRRKNHFKIALRFKEQELPFLQDISSLLYDIELLHDLFLLTNLDEYENYAFSQYFWYRHGRPISKNHKIRTARIIQGSPLTLEMIWGGVEAVLFLLMSINLLRNWRLDNEIKKRKLEKLGIEIEKEKLEVELLRSRLDEREASNFYQSILNRLDSSPFILEGIEITIDDTDEDET